MSVILRPYQTSAVQAVEEAWGSGINRPAVVIATGGGKTTIFSHLIGRHVEEMRKQGQRILVLAHREELLEQAEARIKLQNPDVWTAVVKGSRGQKTHQFADVVVASVQTLARPKRREAIDRIGMVIVDECHNAASKGYRDVLEHYGCMDDRQTPTVGFTATLTRMNGGLPDVWQSVAYQLKIHALIKEGFLVPPVAKSIEVPGLNLATARVTAGDLNTGDIAAALEGSAAFDVIAETWLEQAATPDGPYPYRPTIAFMPNVATCYQLQSAFEARGIVADVVIGDTPATERKASYERFRNGECSALIGAMVLTEGFDAPHTSCVIIARPTLNPGLFIQCTGRGLRLSEGKSDCLILDLAGASLKHSLAGVNDLESDCNANCDCDCLSCGCSDRCKCVLRQCGCRCIEQHASDPKACKCAGTGDCGCGCEGEQPDGDVHCVCSLSAECFCRGDAPEQERKEVAADVLKKLVEVDILGAELAKSSYTWLTTPAGIRFLAVGQEEALFLLPDPNSDGYFQGLVRGTSPKAPVQRLDDGAIPADAALKAMEEHADTTGWTYSNKGASWRRTPASDAQKGLLKRMGVVVPEGCKKGEASDALSAAKFGKVIDGRFGHYAKQPQN